MQTIAVRYTLYKRLRKTSQKIERELRQRTVGKAVGDLDLSFEQCKLPNPMTEIRYYNSRPMLSSEGWGTELGVQTKFVEGDTEARRALRTKFRYTLYKRLRKTKKDIRDWIRQLPDGDIEWQRLQAVAYGPRMEEAILIDGVKRFFDSCKQHNIKVLIVSHKTEFANFDQTRTNLRLAALSWMRRKRFFEADALGLPEEDVYFESTRREKIKRIECLGCTHFIDDLEEIFLEDSFPTYVKKILYSPHAPVALADVMALTTWQEINHYFFDGKS